MKPYSITEETQKLLLNEILELIKEFYGPANIVLIRITNNETDNKASRKVAIKESGLIAELTVSELKKSQN